MTTPFPAEGESINFRLKKNYEKIRRDLEPDRILGYLYQEDVIDEDDMEDVRTQRTRKMKAEQLIQILQAKMRTDPNHQAMEVFVNVLMERQPFLAKLLQTPVDGELYALSQRGARQNMGPIGQIEDKFSDLHIQFPKEQYTEKIGQKAVENESANSSLTGATEAGSPYRQEYVPGALQPIQDEKLPPYIRENRAHSELYPMKHNPRGMAVIVNNKNFEPNKEYTNKSLETRDGSEEDVRKLDELFHELYFKVKIHKDLTGRELIDILKDYRKLDHSTFDAFVLCMMSHGEEDGILGIDGYKVTINEVRDMFNTVNCTTLSGKPKLVIVQACRGLKIEKGELEVKDGPFNAALEAKDQEGEKWNLDLPRPVQQTVAGSADFVIAYACVSGFASFRNVKTGSRFVQAISEVFRDCAGYEHLLDMLTKVNAKVNTMGDKHKKQIPQPLTTLTKKLYFWPYYFENSHREPTTN